MPEMLREEIVRSVEQTGRLPGDKSKLRQQEEERFIYAGAASFAQALHHLHKLPPYFPFDSIVKVDVSSGSATRLFFEGRKFVEQSVFIPTGGGEDHGYDLLVEYVVSEGRCHLVVLDARKIGKRGALVAKFEVAKHLTFPMGFHGFLADE